jgi:hypothetical protein
LDTALKTITPKVFEGAAPMNTPEYIVYHTYGFITAIGDDGVQMKIPKVQLDIIGRLAFDTLVDSVTDLLTALYLPYEIVSIGYDDEWANKRCIVHLEVI